LTGAYREDLNWLVTDFTTRVADIAHAIVVSADGVPLALSAGIPGHAVEQFSAITSGLTSLIAGAARIMEAGMPLQALVEMAPAAAATEESKSHDEILKEPVAPLAGQLLPSFFRCSAALLTNSGLNPPAKVDDLPVVTLVVVAPYGGFISPNGRDEIASGPKMLSHEVALAFSTDARQVDCALALYEPYHLRHRILRRDRIIMRT